MVEINAKNFKIALEIGIAAYTAFAMIYTSYVYLVLLQGALIMLLVSSFKKDAGFYLNWVELYNIYADGEDGREFGALKVSQIAPRAWSHETIWDYEKKPGRLYFIKNRQGMIDVVLLDPNIPSLDKDPMIDNLHTDIEWHNQGQFRNYIRRKWREMSRPVMDDLLKNLDQGEFLQSVKNKLSSNAGEKQVAISE